jgi:hypothetical protein
MLGAKRVAEDFLLRFIIKGYGFSGFCSSG